MGVIITYKIFLEQINSLGTKLYDMGLKGKKIAVIGRNRYDIYVAGPKPFELENEVQITLTPISLEYLVSGEWSIDINVINDYQIIIKVQK